MWRPLGLSPLVFLPRADLSGLIDSLTAAQHILEMYRRSIADDSTRRLLDRITNRIVKTLTVTCGLGGIPNAALELNSLVRRVNKCLPSISWRGLWECQRGRLAFVGSVGCRMNNLG
jgi:hypothetical protein